MKMSMSKILAVSFSASLTFVMSLNTACAAAESKQAATKSTPLTQAYVWYDGDREQQVWLDPKIVAEFDLSPRGESLVKSVYSGAKPLPAKRPQAGVRLWQLDDAAETAIHNLKSIHPEERYSVVLHDGRTSSGRMRALPGNIIVYLDPQWNQTAVNIWLSAHKLEIVKKLEIGTNIYVIKTGPGIEALDAANALYRSGEVKAAFPDWWQAVSTR